MLRLSRLVLIALTLNLSVAGWAAPCAHAVVVAAAVPADGHDAASHSSHAPKDEQRVPCDDDVPACCTALTSCGMCSVPARIFAVNADGVPSTPAVPGTTLRPHTLLLEVATPPPRG